MSRRIMFPSIDPAIVVQAAQFLKNSAEYRGKGVLDIVERVTDFIGADGHYPLPHLVVMDVVRRSGFTIGGLGTYDARVEEPG
jgi:hypothetical protein